MKYGRWLFSLTLVLSACAPQATPTRTTTIPSVPLPTQTARPTRIAGPTPTLIPTPTSMGPLPPTPALTTSPPDFVDAHGVPMQLVPAGEFIMGSDTGTEDAKPAHRVYLDAFYIDRYEATHAFYKACVEAGGCALPEFWSTAFNDYDYSHPNSDDYPVRQLDWYMAAAYCEWRGARLLTEAEWEKAARGTDGRTYPWGNSKECSNGNFDGCQGAGQGGPFKVGSYGTGTSPYGVYDMAGNLQEWVADWYSDNYYQDSPSSNPLGPASGELRVLKSSHWSMVESGAAGRWGWEPDDIGKGTFGVRCARAGAP